MRPWASRVTAVLVGVLFSSATAELAARAFDFDARWLDRVAPRQKADRDVHSIFDDGERLYGLRPMARRRFFGRRAGDPVERRPAPRDVRIDGRGLRGPERQDEAAAGALRIVAIGSSNTYGASVSDGEDWPARLESELRTRGHHAEVWNAGVPGTVLRQQIALGREAARHWAPDLLIVQLYNQGTRLLLVGDEAGRVADLDPTVWHEWLCDGVPAALAPVFRWSSAVRTAWTATQVRRWSADREACAAKVTPRADAQDVERWAAFVREVQPLPVLLLVTPAGVSEPFLTALSWPTLDLRPLLGTDGEVGRIHPGPAVYGRYATALADSLEARGCLAGADERRARCATP